jgi:hypothetical protein
MTFTPWFVWTCAERAGILFSSHYISLSDNYQEQSARIDTDFRR